MKQAQAMASAFTGFPASEKAAVRGRVLSRACTGPWDTALHLGEIGVGDILVFITSG